MSDTNLPITFGVELEFLVKYANKSRNWVANHILETFKEKGIPNVTRDYDDAFHSWQIKTDGSVHHSEHDPKFHAFEITSPVLTFGTTDHQAITRVCNIIRENYEFDVNYTCGLHIHVGKGRESTLTFKELKNIYAILWTFERRLDKLHPTNRQGNTHCRSLHSQSPLGLANLSPSESLQKILSRNTRDEVIALFFELDQRMKYDPFHLRESAEVKPSVKRTLEFRQHEGTLDPEKIINWATVCSKLLQYAGEVPQADLEKFLRDNVEDERTFTAVDLIEKIGREREAQYYRSRLDQ